MLATNVKGKVQAAATAVALALAAAQFLQPAFADEAAIRDGHADRQAWETWFGALSGAYRAGAEFWADHRSDPRPPDCASTSDIAFRSGCEEGKKRLDEGDHRRRTEPDYKAGWNSPLDAVPTPPSPAQDQKESDHTTAQQEQPSQQTGPSEQSPSPSLSSLAAQVLEALANKLRQSTETSSSAEAPPPKQVDHTLPPQPGSPPEAAADGGGVTKVSCPRVDGYGNEFDEVIFFGFQDTTHTARVVLAFPMCGMLEMYSDGATAPLVIKKGESGDFMERMRCGMAGALLAGPVEQHVRINNDSVIFSGVKDGETFENWLDRDLGLLHNADGTTIHCSALPDKKF
jgi:hypothetical protein